MLSVTYINREHRKSNFSMEGIFDAVKSALKGKIEIRDFFADGKVSRWANIQNVKKHAGPINHITGDVNFLALGLGGKKNILTIHDFGYYENPVHPWYRKAVYHTFWFYLPLKYINIVTVVSEFTKEKLIRYFKFPENRIRVVYDPVKPIFTRHEKLTLNQQPTILQIGSGDHKNVMGLIEAVKGSRYHIEIVGWPSEKEKAKLQEYGISHNISNSLTDQQVLDKYIEADILYFASFYEGFGMPIVEAQAVGRPVISSKLGAMEEIGRGSAILVDPKSIGEIKSAIDDLFADRAHYNQTVANGFANAEKYNYINIANKYLEVYKEVVNY